MRRSIRRLNAYERSHRYRNLLILIAITWSLIIATIIFIDPDNLKDIPFPNSYLPMSSLLFIGFFFIYTLLLLSSKQALLWSVATIIFLYLRLYNIASLFTGIFLFGFLISLKIYLKLNQSHSN